MADEKKYYGVYAGTVVFRVDPMTLGRIKVRVPGLLEPGSPEEGPWAWPRGAGGSPQWGRNSVPPLDADVLVQFVDGDLDSPIWELGSHGRPIVEGQARSEAFPEHEHPDIHVWGIGPFRVVLDDRQGSRSLTIKMIKQIKGQEESTAWIEFNHEDNSLQIHADSALQVAAGALVDIDGPVVQVRGRKVVPSPKPIN
jgi:hypothetical protein